MKCRRKDRKSGGLNEEVLLLKLPQSGGGAWFLKNQFGKIKVGELDFQSISNWIFTVFEIDLCRLKKQFIEIDFYNLLFQNLADLPKTWWMGGHSPSQPLGSYEPAWHYYHSRCGFQTSCVATCQVNRRQCENPFVTSNIGSTKQKKTESDL